MSYPALEVVDVAFVREIARGFDFGVISLAESLGAFLGNLVTGYALDHFGPRAGRQSSAGPGRSLLRARVQPLAPAL
jgi:hypothetical protein